VKVYLTLTFMQLRASLQLRFDGLTYHSFYFSILFLYRLL